jgi:RimJ/RimL family protein N-acetyltransferase
MFARTQRLLLRPGFPEDASALLAAMGDERILRHITGLPWPYRLEEAQASLARDSDPLLPSLLVFERTAGAPRLVGGCRLARRLSGAVEIGFWVGQADQGRGLAHEAAAALIDIARTLRLSSIEASHFVDNPKAARVLEKLGFRSNGLIAPRFCAARNGEAPARLYRMSLAGRRAAAPPVELEETLAA